MADQAAGQSGQAADQSKYKIKVDGQELEFSLDELREHAQKGVDYTKKMQVLAEEKKTLKAQEERVASVKAIVDEMEKDPGLSKALNKVYSDHKSGRISKSEAQDRNLKLLDKRIEEAEEAGDLVSLKSLKEIDQIIKEETNIGAILEKFDSLEKEVNFLKNTAALGQTDRVENQLGEMRSRFGKDMIEKYEADIKAASLKYPGQDIEKLFYHYASKDDLRTALLNEHKKKEKDEIDKKKNGSAPGGSSVHTPVDVPRDKGGRVNWSGFIKNMKTSGKL